MQFERMRYKNCAAIDKEGKRKRAAERNPACRAAVQESKTNMVSKIMGYLKERAV